MTPVEVTMNLVEVIGPNEVRVRRAEVPTPGPNDVVVKVRACGICGSDVTYMHLGGMPGKPRRGPLALGHEAAGEVAAVGAGVVGIAVADRVVINPIGSPNGTIGNGGTEGALADYLLIRDAELGASLGKMPADMSFEVAALNEPMAVARHFVNRADPEPEEKVIVFGAGPIGLGATIWLKLRGVKHVVVADIIPARLEKALQVGADAVIDTAREDIRDRLLELHGPGFDGAGQARVGTDLFMDAAGAGVAVESAIANCKFGARIVIAAMHKTSVKVDFSQLLYSESTITMAMGYPTEIFTITNELGEHSERFGAIISDVFPFSEVEQALELARTPGAADKIVVTFD